RGGVELAHRGVLRGAAVHDYGERGGVGGEARESAAPVAHLRRERPLAQQRERRSDVLERAATEAAALRRAPAGKVELLARGRRVVWEPAVVRAIERVGAVEHERAHLLRVPQCEGLREE